jgi:hypothetical protein
MVGPQPSVGVVLDYKCLQRTEGPTVVPLSSMVAQMFCGVKSELDSGESGLLFSEDTDLHR